jgi:hypothetical protein
MALTVRDTLNSSGTGGTLSFIGTATAGDNTLKAAVTGNKFRVTGMQLFPGNTTASAPSLKSGASTVLFGTVPLDATGAAGLPKVDLPFNPAGHVVTTVSEALVLNNTAVPMSGSVSYVIE